ncbi:MAG: tRNA 2-selenouridine(34) synthase MnmH [Paracoccaceae bacterium]
MPVTFSSLPELLDCAFDTFIDVRSPAEFAEDHIPGAINLPVLSNAERAEVGTIYVQQSPFLARKIGAAKVFRNAAAAIEGPLRDKEGGWRPLVYCWRGGQRSGSFGWMLGQIGWRSDTIKGGYQTYRGLVHDYLYSDALPFRMILIDGYTGTAKTELLEVLEGRGCQVLDLEGLAEHRGSLLGGMGVPQPSQKAFETRIAAKLCRFDPARPVLVEAESSKVGERSLPPSLWAAMKAGARITITAPIAVRTSYLVKAYDDILSDAPAMRDKLEPLRKYRGNAVVDGWFEYLDAGDKPAVTRALMEQHYDPSYAKSRKRAAVQEMATLTTGDLGAEGLSGLADQIETLLEALPQPADSVT